jgi:hypothetical protein
MFGFSKQISEFLLGRSYVDISSFQMEKMNFGVPYANNQSTNRHANDMKVFLPTF